MPIIDAITMREIALPLKTPFVTGVGRVDVRRVIIIEARCQGVVGYGEASPLSDPYYTEETTETAWHILESFLIPRVLGKRWRTPFDIAAMLAPVRRHFMAKAGLEGAAWDLYARSQGVSLAKALGGASASVPAGISIGIPGDLETLALQVEKALKAGYARVKIKIKPGWDIEPVRMLRERLGDFPLMVDANSAYTLADTDHLRRLDEFNLLMIEQPLAWDDLFQHAQLQAALKTPICLDESITSLAAARLALELESCRVINIKPGRVGGLSEAVRIHDWCRSHGVPVWCGGMLESGIGRAHNLALASLPGFTLPGDLSPSDRYFEREIVKPPITLLPSGRLPVPDGPGIGVEVDVQELERRTVRLRSFHA